MLMEMPREKYSLDYILKLRGSPEGGVVLRLTRTRPLDEHGDRQPSKLADELDENIPQGFLESLSRWDRPGIIALTGGEPLLRPKLVCEISSRTHHVSSGLVVATSMAHARRHRRTRIVDRALDAADHVVARLTPRRCTTVDKALLIVEIKRTFKAGTHASLQLVGFAPNDPRVMTIARELRGQLPELPVWVEDLDADKPVVRVLSPEEQWLTYPLAPWPIVDVDGSVGFGAFGRPGGERMEEPVHRAGYERLAQAAAEQPLSPATSDASYAYRPLRLETGMLTNSWGG